ncbi:MAG: SRPBCC family protein [Burkholderiaceae bacterium]
MNPIKKPKLIKGLAAATLVLAVAPFTLPAQVHLERAAVVPADAATVYALVSSSQGFQQFNPWRDNDPSLKITLTGPASGVGSGFIFEGAEGRGTQTITAVEKNRAVTMLIDLGPMGQPVQTFLLSPQDGGTRVTWTLDSEFGFNPVGRVMGLFMDGMLGQTWERGLNNLSIASKQNAA